MLPEIQDMIQLIAFADAGTLSAASEKLHLSQPTLTRTMKRLEELFGAPLFDHAKNKLTLNENGQLAVDCARKVIEETEQMLVRVQALERSRHTIPVGSVASVPLWDTVQRVSNLYPGMTVSTELRDTPDIRRGLLNGAYLLAILPEKPVEEGIECRYWGSEQLYFALPASHPKAQAHSLTFQEMDGENMLLLSDIGFWHHIPEDAMPNTRFLRQSGRYEFNELISASVLPFFLTDQVIRQEGVPEGRIAVPISDENATAHFYLCWQKGNHLRLSAFLKGLYGV